MKGLVSDDRPTQGSGTELDFRAHFEEIQLLIGRGPGLDRRAYERVLSIRRTLYVAATTEEQCRHISSTVRLIRRWFSSEPMLESDIPRSRDAVTAAVARLGRMFSVPSREEGRDARLPRHEMARIRS